MFLKILTLSALKKDNQTETIFQITEILLLASRNGNTNLVQSFGIFPGFFFFSFPKSNSALTASVIWQPSASGTRDRLEAEKMTSQSRIDPARILALPPGVLALVEPVGKRPDAAAEVIALILVLDINFQMQ